MKLSKKAIALGISALSLAGVVVATALTISKAPQKASKVSEVAAANGYTTYYDGDLGFATRDANDSRVVLGDTDHGEQAVGASLAAKSEQVFTFKRTRSNYWMGVGGYAVYVSSDTTIRFIYLTYSSSTNYQRTPEISNLVLKTADGSTELTSVTGDGKLFSDYTTAVIRFDLSNPSAVKAHFHVVFNGVEYYTFNGSTLVDEVTYTHTCSGFADSYLDKAMCGYNGTDGGLSVIKFQNYDNIKNLNNVFTTVSNTVFSYSNIGDYFFTINLSEQIFSTTGYLNDHLSSYKDYNNQVINLGDGIVINGHTFNYWRDFTDEELVYTSSTGVHSFPLSAGGQFAPIAIQAETTSLAFKVNADFIPLDSIVVTFKAGLFAGYNSSTHNTYKLSEDVTYYSTLEDSNSTAINDPSISIKFVRALNDRVETTYQFTDVANNGVQTNSGGYSYYKYTLWTNIPRNTNFNQTWTQDHYRYLYNNILLNGKPLSNHNSWARANALDSTAEYETKHATGSANANYDLAIQLKLANDQSNYVFWIYFPYQLMTDRGLGTPSITLRQGAAWLTPTGVARVGYVPGDLYAVQGFVADNMHMDDYNSNLGYCADNEHHYYLTAKAAFNGLTSAQQSMFQDSSEFADAKARYEAWGNANNDANPYDNNNDISSSNVLLPVKAENNAFIIIIIAAVTTIYATAVVLMIRRRKAN